MDATGHFLELYRRVAELERRADSAVKQGRVEEVDAAKGTVRVRLGGSDEEPFLSPPIPYAQVAGAMKVHSPPSVGQQMTVINGGGEFRQGLAVPMTWSDQNESPSDSGDEHVLTFGDVRVDLTDGGVRISAAGVMVNISGDGLAIEGGTVTHDAVNIGSDHTHGGVTAGMEDTDVPRT